MTEDDIEGLRARIEQLEKADRAKDQFLSLLSHELRNHIHAIRTNAWLIKARARDVDLARPTDAIDRQVVKLSRLVEDLLDVVRVTQKSHLAFEDVPIQQVVASAVAAAQMAVSTHRRELMVAVPDGALYIHADPIRLQQALSNIVQNAVKYSAQQSTVTVRVTEEGGFVLVSIKDHGVGIAPADLPGIFDLHPEGKGERKPNSEGLGIGLHIARQLVQAHGGTVSAASEGPGKGSEFTVSLPLVASPSNSLEDASLTPKGSGALSILVVDDNRDAADSLAMLLEAHGHRVEAVYGGEEAVQRAARGDVQVALVDIGMPTVDGFQVAQRITATPAARDTLLVAVTGWGEKSDRVRSRQAGFAYHLTKPVDFATLASLLATAARRPY